MPRALARTAKARPNGEGTVEKKLVILGGSRYILPVIEAAHEMGVYVVTMDYLPDNIAHRYSDEYVNVSIVEKEAVLAACRELGADGIMSFAADPGCVPAAYVAEQMGLPFQGSYEAVSILQNKARFRAFLADNGFNCPKAFSFSSAAAALEAAEELPFPVIVKPTDSAGSKGCTRVEGVEGLVEAVEYALSFSLSGTCIIEQFIDKLYPSSDADSFTVDGRFECVSFTSQFFDDEAVNPYTPAAFSMPAQMPAAYQEQISADLQRLSDLLGLKDGAYNVETRIATDGLPYIMEISPRGGGNRLCEMLRYASGIDLIRASVQAALGESVTGLSMPDYQGVWYQQVLYSDMGGVFRGVEYAEGFAMEHVVNEQIVIVPGTRVEGFSAANHAFGSVFLRFDTQDELDEFRAARKEYMRVRVDR